MQAPTLPPNLRIFERGWLSSNNILICGDDACALIDSGYVSHAPQTLALVQRSGRTQGTRYFVDPALLRDADLKIPTTLLRIEPHRLLELVREDLRRYPLSKIGEIGGRIGLEVNRSQLKRALAELVSLGAVVMTGERSAARYRLALEK